MVTQAQSISRRATALQRTFAAAFAALDDLKAKEPAAANEIAATCQSHIRSAFPSAIMVDSAPFVRVEPEPVPAAAIERTIHGDGSYRLAADDGCLVLSLRDFEADRAVGVMTIEQAETFGGDVASVIAAIRGSK